MIRLLTGFQYFVMLRGYEQKHRSVYGVGLIVRAARGRAMIVAWAEPLSRNVAISLDHIKLLNSKVLMSRQGCPRRHSDQRRGNAACLINVQRLKEDAGIDFLPVTLSGVNRHKLIRRNRRHRVAVS